MLSGFKHMIFLFIVYIKTGDIYKVIAEDAGTNLIVQTMKEKNVIILSKDELGGKIMK